MKRMLLLLLLLLLISSVSMADDIGLYSDASGQSCDLGPAGVFNPNATVIHKFSTGATGSRFKVVFPAGTSFFAFNTPYIVVGALTSDLLLNYGQCLTGTIVLGNILAVYGAGTCQVMAADALPNVLYTDCSFVARPATGGKAFTAGMNNGCTPLALESSTWGGVKALYR